MPSWRPIDGVYAVEHIAPQDECLFLMERDPDATYENQAKSHISNFQSHHTPSRSSFRESSCRQFADDLSLPIGDLLDKHGGRGNVGLAFLPTSKLIGSDAYDDRFEIVCRILVKRFEGRLFWERPIVNLKARGAVKQRSGRRDKAYVDRIKQNYKWLGFEGDIGLLLVIDDVITSGGQFKAFKELVSSHHPALTMVGMFWARTRSTQVLA